jgi:hypothetical protein
LPVRASPPLARESPPPRCCPALLRARASTDRPTVREDPDTIEHGYTMDQRAYFGTVAELNAYCKVFRAMGQRVANQMMKCAYESILLGFRKVVAVS